MKKTIYKICVIAVWVLIWQVVTVAVDNRVLFAGPVDVLRAAARLAAQSSYWLSILKSLSRIIPGVLIGVLIGVGCGTLAYKVRRFGTFIEPMMTAIKAVPVASYVILILIWFGASYLSLIVCALVVYPILYHSTLEGLTATDRGMLEMAAVYDMRLIGRLRSIYLPQLRPYMLSAVKLAVGMGFKSGTAAEVIAQVQTTMGNGLYLAKIYLETADLIVWTVTIIILSHIIEKIFVMILRDRG